VLFTLIGSMPFEVSFLGEGYPVPNESGGMYFTQYSYFGSFDLDEEEWKNQNHYG